jgi:hypothetical protein
VVSLLGLKFISRVPEMTEAVPIRHDDVFRRECNRDRDRGPARMYGSGRNAQAQGHQSLTSDFVPA